MRTQPATWRTKQTVASGFTYLEILIVLLILGIVAMLGAPMLASSMDEVRLAGAASEAVTALEYAQLTAVGGGGQTRVIFKKVVDTIGVREFKPTVDLNGSQTTLAEADVENGAFTLMEHPLRPGVDYRIFYKNESRFEGVDLVNALFGGIDSVTFDALGIPSAGGTVTLALGDRQIVLSVDGLTGKVTQSD